MNKNQRIEELENQVARYKMNAEFYESLYESYARRDIYYANRLLSMRDELRKAKVENQLLNDVISAALDYIEDLEDQTIAVTENAGAVTLEEIAQLVIDGKPIERLKLVPVQIGACVPKMESTDEKSADK